MKEELSFEQVHLWTVHLDPDREELPISRHPFSHHELSRASSYKFEQLQTRFLTGRLRLRQILSLYTGCPIEQLEFTPGYGGKPLLKKYPKIRFSLSRSDGVQMVAVAYDREVGVDLEKLRNDDFGGVIARFFSPAEKASLQTVTGREMSEVFFRIWTRKEAYLKAMGVGLSYSLPAFTMSGRIGDTDALVHDDGSNCALTSWRVAEISTPTGYCGALAAAGREWECHNCQFSL